MHPKDNPDRPVDSPTDGEKTEFSPREKTGFSADLNKTAEMSFGRFVWKTPENRRYLAIAFCGIVVQFILFRIWYPHADFGNDDSYTYIDCALRNFPISYRPVGYSVFLSLIHSISQSDGLLVGAQYFGLQLAALGLFFTVRYFFSPVKIISIVLFCCLLLNPVSLYLSNYVMSDVLFATLSLVWFTLLLWIVNKPAWSQLIIQAVLLLIIFKVRYTAMYYPIVALPAFILSAQKRWFRFMGLVLSILPIGLDVLHTRERTYKETGTPVFCAFSGWQIANNALHIYPYTKVDSTDLPSRESRELNEIVQRYFDTAAVNIRRRSHELSTFYMWAPADQSPMKHYMVYYGKKRHEVNYFNNWNAVALIFSEYGYALIKKHPLAFASYYLWPNAMQYFLPPLEILTTEHTALHNVDPIATKWFGYKGLPASSGSNRFEEILLKPLPYSFFLLNIIFAAAFTWLLVKRKKMNMNPGVVHTILLAVVFVVMNFCFSVFSTPVYFRYQLFPLLILLTFSLVMLSLIVERFMAMCRVVAGADCPTGLDGN